LSADECCFKLNFLFRLATVSEVSKADKKSSTIFQSSGRHGSRFAIFSSQTYLIIPCPTALRQESRIKSCSPSPLVGEGAGG
ncbi:MAG: hypothetical protein MUC60_10555, partial [Oscillatoria sp. Prado101]|nr:hypothetical protein [Oscillatoria sp. Prado101]